MSPFWVKMRIFHFKNQWIVVAVQNYPWIQIFSYIGLVVFPINSGQTNKQTNTQTNKEQLRF